jgi:hypothetical protein
MYNCNRHYINYLFFLFTFVVKLPYAIDNNSDLEFTVKNNIKILQMKDVTQTNIDIYPRKTYITQRFNCNINDQGNVKLDFNVYELSYAELQIFFDNGTDLISANQINYTYEELGNDLLFRNWIGKPVDILGGGLAATVSGTLIKYENKKAFVKGVNGRFYLVNFNDPQGVRIFLKRDSDNDMYYYKHIITAKFANLKNQQGTLVVKYKTRKISADVYYSLYKKNANNIDLDLRAQIKNNSSVKFHNPEISIFKDNHLLTILNKKNTEDTFSNKIFNNPTTKVEDNSLKILKDKNIHDILIKNCKEINFDEVYIVDMSNSNLNKKESLTVNRSYLLNSDEIFLNAKVVINTTKEELSIDNLDSKYLFYNKHTNKKYIAIDKDKNITIQNSINTQRNKDNTDVFESEKTFWNVFIQNKYDKPINLYLIYNNEYIIEDISFSKATENNWITAKIPANTNKKIQYSKILR